MALIENTDFVAINKAGYYVGRRTLQQHGNIVATKTKLIINIIYTMDVMQKAFGGESDAKTGYREVDEPLNPFNVKKQFRAIKDSVHNVGEATKDLKSSWKEAGQDFKKMRDQGKYHGLILEIAKDSESVKDFEERVMGLAEDHPASLVIPVENIKEFKAGFLGNCKLTLDNGQVMKIFMVSGKKAVKQMLNK